MINKAFLGFSVARAALFGLLWEARQEAAFSCYRCFQTLGLVVAFASSAVCVSTKVYAMSCVLAAGLVLYSAVEYSLHRCLRYRGEGGVIVVL